MIISSKIGRKVDVFIWHDRNVEIKSNVNAADKFIENLVENQKKVESVTIYEYYKQGDEYQLYER